MKYDILIFYKDGTTKLKKNSKYKKYRKMKKKDDNIEYCNLYPVGYFK